MSTKTKTKTETTETKTMSTKAKKDNLAELGLPALWARFTEATGETTKSPNKRFRNRSPAGGHAAMASDSTA